MSEVHTIDVLQHGKVKGLFSAIFCCLLVIGITISLFIYNQTLSSQVEEIKWKIEQRDLSIIELRSNPNIDTYTRYETNSAVFSALQRQSEIPLFVSHLKKNLQRFGLEMWDLNYKTGEVEIQLKSETNQEGYAYQKILQFMKAYRADEKALFDLNNIQELRWYDRINYIARFTLK